jgi:hypothetical protein
MLMPKRNGQYVADFDSLAQKEPTLWDTFKHVYGFILRGVNGDKRGADVIFQDYLAGKLSAELLSISRRSVNADQAQGRQARDALKSPGRKRRKLSQRERLGRVAGASASNREPPSRSVIRSPDQPSTAALQATNSSHELILRARHGIGTE